MRPKWGIVDSDKGPEFKHTTFLNNCTCVLRGMRKSYTTQKKGYIDEFTR